MGLCPSLSKAWATNKDGLEMEIGPKLLQKAAQMANKWAEELLYLFTKEKETLSNRLQRAKIFCNITSIVHWEDDFLSFRGAITFKASPSIITLLSLASTTWFIVAWVALAFPHKGLPGSKMSVQAKTTLPWFSLPTTATDVLFSLIAASKFNFTQLAGGGVHLRIAYLVEMEIFFCWKKVC